MLSLVFCLHVFCFQDGDLTVQERFRVQYVLLDVAAYDKRGKDVTDLKAADFEVRENGKKVAVNFFDILDYRSTAAPVTAEPPADTAAPVEGTPVRPIRQVIIALDLESTRVQEAKNAFAQLRGFLQQLDNTIDYRINLYSMLFGSVTDGFENRPEDVLAALSRLEDRHFAKVRGRRDRSDTLLKDRDKPAGFTSRTGRPGVGGRMLGNVNDMTSLEEALINCKRSYDTPTAKNRCIDDTLAQFKEEQLLRSERVIGELEILTYKFEETDGLKIMMFISPGFALSGVHAAYRMGAAYKGGRGDFAQTSLTGGSFKTESDFRRIVHGCIKNRVIFHTFDIFNVNADARRNSVIFDRDTPNVAALYEDFAYEVGEGLDSLAEESGGTSHKSIHLVEVLGKTIESGRFFYLLGYDSPAGKPGKFRKLKLKVKRRGVKLRHRAGYFGAE